MATKDSVSKSVADVVLAPAHDDAQGPTPDAGSTSDSNDEKQPPPLLAKLFAVLLISCISFGSHWSSGVTGAMKSTIKKVYRPNPNTGS